MQKRRRFLLPLAIIVAVLAAVGIVVFMMSGKSTSSVRVSNTHAAVALPSSSASATIPAMPATDVQRIEAALGSSSRQTQATALVKEHRSLYLEGKQRMFPPGTTITVQQGTFRVNDQSAAVDVTTSGNENYTLYLYRENGGWYVLYMEAK